MSFAEAAEQHLDDVYGYLAWFTGDRGVAEELTAGEREVIALRILLDCDAVTAARVLGISPTNCTTRLNRALRKLEEALDVAA